MIKRISYWLLGTPLFRWAFWAGFRTGELMGWLDGYDSGYDRGRLDGGDSEWLRWMGL